MTTTDASLFCRHCGAGLAPGLEFCGHCGAKAETSPVALRPCPRCGAPTTPGAAFCRACGAKVPDPATAAVTPSAQAMPAPAGFVPRQDGPTAAASPQATPGGPVPAGTYRPAQGGSAPTSAYPPATYPPSPAPGAPSSAPGLPPGAYGPPPGPYGPPGAYGPPPGAVAPQPLAGAAPQGGPAGPVAARLGRRGRLSAVMKFGIVAVVLVIIGSVAVQIAKGPSQGCVYACAPVTGAAQPNGNVYTSPYGFGFAYPGGWQRVSIGHPFLAGFGHPASTGTFVVEGGNGTPSLPSVIGMGGQFVSSQFQQASAVGAIPGAEMGDQPGAGVLYSAVAQSNGQQIPLRVAVVAAEQAGHWALMIGIASLDPSATPTGVQSYDSASFDDVLTQWSWNRT